MGGYKPQALAPLPPMTAEELAAFIAETEAEMAAVASRMHAKLIDWYFAPLTLASPAGGEFSSRGPDVRKG